MVYCDLMILFFQRKSKFNRCGNDCRHRMAPRGRALGSFKGRKPGPLIRHPGDRDQPTLRWIREQAPLGHQGQQKENHQKCGNAFHDKPIPDSRIMIIVSSPTAASDPRYGQLNLNTLRTPRRILAISRHSFRLSLLLIPSGAESLRKPTSMAYGTSGSRLLLSS